MGKSAPKAPDPYATAAAQTQANTAATRESAKLNAVDQYGPYGSTTYQRAPDGVPVSQTVSLAPGVQNVFNNQVGIADQLTGKASQLVNQIPTGPMDISGLPSRQTSIANAGAVQGSVPSQSANLQTYNSNGLPELPGANDFGAAAKTAQDAAFAKAQALLQPGQQQEQSQLVQSLSDRGIPLDSAAGQAELNRMQQAQSEAQNRAAYDAVSAGAAEQSRQYGLAAAARNQLHSEGLATAGFNNQVADSRFGQDMTAAQFANSAQAQRYGQSSQNAAFTNQQRNDALTESMMLRNQSFNEASAMLQGAPAMQSPGFMNQPAYSMQPADITGQINQNYQNQLNSYNNRQQGLWGSVSNLGTAWLMS
ncbi:hypothetical protein FPY71_11565 [Aureimonas fodinaquatilis]|uniref:Tail fiber domain-containing protein n=1 Tax=Aureimonas fodinaquatilis TaxID=2565783 RepID=A0A5B0DX47_9HYPH|nr:hypothetical protein [Aureimonas fodinaquatilis]KAA0971076.1 hypothetical protein FPY71_11565 [Aureimonas fodinaquatilis]